MKSVIYFLLAVLLGVAGVMPSVAQTDGVKERLAVYVTGKKVDDKVKEVFSCKLGTAIASSGQFELVETGSEFLADLQTEMDSQTLGEMCNSQIAALGQKYGVKIVVVADISDFDEELFVIARSINVESGFVSKTIDAWGPSKGLENLENLAQKVANALFGELASAHPFIASKTRLDKNSISL